jgi:hypothetical protein
MSTDLSASLVGLVPSGVVTVTSTTMGPLGTSSAGETATISVGERTVKFTALVEPNLTALAPLKLLPRIVTDVPPKCVPQWGTRFVTVGPAASAVS